MMPQSGSALDDLSYDPERSIARGCALLESQRATIPERYRWARFTHARFAERVRASARVIERARTKLLGKSALLFGPTGAGKTTLACALLAELFADGEAVVRSRAFRRAESGGWDSAAWTGDEYARFALARMARFMSTSDLARAPRETPLGREPELVRDAIAASYLVLDDLGTDVTIERSTAVRDVIMARHDRAKPTVVTTFMAVEDLTAHYGAGVVRRLQDGIAFVQLEAR